jgi:hypothetical protein
VLLEEAGVPATVLITEPFQGIVASHAVRLGMPGYHALVVPHPIWAEDDDGLQALARQVVDVALAQLTAS